MGEHRRGDSDGVAQHGRSTLVDLLSFLGWRLPLQHFNKFSWEPAFAAVACPAFPPLCLDLDPRIDLHARTRIQLSHHCHDLVLLQTELRRRRRLEPVHRAHKCKLRRVEGREGLLALLLVLGMELELLLLLLLLLLLSCRVIGEKFDELVHGVGDAEERDEEEDERLLARVGRRGLLRRPRGGALHRAAVEELAELTAHLRAVAPAAATGEDIAEPADESKEAEHAAKGVAELGELVDDAGEGEEGRVGRHEGRLEHLREAGEGLHDRVQERERRRRRRLERLCHARVRRVERHAAWLAAAVHAHPTVCAWVHPVHAVHAVAVAAVAAKAAHATV